MGNILGHGVLVAMTEKENISEGQKKQKITFKMELCINRY